MKFLITMTDIEGEWDGLPADEAKTVRMDADGRLSVADGPYSGAREYMGGFYIIEADSILRRPSPLRLTWRCE
jgi:hypothetical protein